MKLARLVCAMLLLLGPCAYAQLPPDHQPDMPFITDLKDVLKHPKPEYPRALRAKHITGAGVFELVVDAPSGQVIEVSVIKSTGSMALNRCAVEALKRWIFRPNFVSRVRVPIAFTL